MIGGETTVADVLAFAAWPTEMQEIARRAVRDELANLNDEAKEELRDEGGESQHDIDQTQFAVVHEHLDRVKRMLGVVVDRIGAHSLEVDAGSLLIEMHGLAKDALEKLAEVPDELADVREPTP